LFLRAEMINLLNVIRNGMLGLTPGVAYHNNIT